MQTKIYTIQYPAPEVTRAERKSKMKLADVITSHNYCVIDTMTGHWNCDVFQEEEEYQSITFVRELTIPDLKQMQDELDIYAYEVIQENGGFEGIETIEEYNAVTEDGEEIRIFVPDLW